MFCQNPVSLSRESLIKSVQHQDYITRNYRWGSSDLLQVTTNKSDPRGSPASLQVVNYNNTFVSWNYCTTSNVVGWSSRVFCFSSWPIKVSWGSCVCIDKRQRILEDHLLYDPSSRIFCFGSISQRTHLIYRIVKGSLMRIFHLYSRSLKGSQEYFIYDQGRWKDPQGS